jgi:hypothetical protein
MKKANRLMPMVMCATALTLLAGGCKKQSAMPTPSGVMKIQPVQEIFRRSGELDGDAKLAELSPSTLTQPEFQSGRKVCSTSGADWEYEFEAASGSFAIPTHALAKVKMGRAHSEVSHWLTLDHLSKCVIDCGTAILISESKRMQVSMRALLALRAPQITGEVRPAWLVPYQLNGKAVGVLADAGDVIIQVDDSSWRLASESTDR